LDQWYPVAYQLISIALQKRNNSSARFTTIESNCLDQQTVWISIYTCKIRNCADHCNVWCSALAPLIY